MKFFVLVKRKKERKKICCFLCTYAFFHSYFLIHYSERPCSTAVVHQIVALVTLVRLLARALFYFIQCLKERNKETKKEKLKNWKKEKNIQTKQNKTKKWIKKDWNIERKKQREEKRRKEGAFLHIVPFLWFCYFYAMNVQIFLFKYI